MLALFCCLLQSFCALAVTRACLRTACSASWKKRCPVVSLMGDEDMDSCVTPRELLHCCLLIDKREGSWTGTSLALHVALQKGAKSFHAFVLA